MSTFLHRVGLLQAFDGGPVVAANALYSFDAGSRTEWFVDKSAIESSSGVLFTTQRPEKYSSNPVLEPSGANSATWDYDKYYVNALFEAGTYKIWHGNIDFTTPDYSGSSYATSANGQTSWTKPNLGAVTYDGNTNNNIFDAGYDPTVIKDGSSYIILIGANASGASLNKALIYSSATGYSGLSLQKTITHGSYCEFHGLAKRADGRWLAYYTYGQLSNLRGVGAYLSNTSDITGTWVDQGIILPVISNLAQYYYFSPTLLNGVLYGFAGRYDSVSDTIWVDLYTSIDGVAWTPRKSQWVPVGSTYDTGMIFGKSLTDDGSELRFYYGGSTETHEEAIPRDSRVSYAGLTRGRMAEVSGASSGTIVTTAFTPSDDLIINSDFAGDNLKIELLDPADDSVLTGYSKDDCDNLDGDSTSKVVTWDSNAIPAQSLKLKFYLSGGAALAGAAKSRLTTTTTTSLPHNVNTRVQWDTVDITGDFREAGTPTHGFIVPVGVNRVDVSAFITNSSGTPPIVSFVKNGAHVVFQERMMKSVSGSRYCTLLATSVPVQEGDTFVVHTYHNHGVTEQANGAGGEYYFEIRDASI